MSKGTFCRYYYFRVTRERNDVEIYAVTDKVSHARAFDSSCCMVIVPTKFPLAYVLLADFELYTHSQAFIHMLTTEGIQRLKARKDRGLPLYFNDIVS